MATISEIVNKIRTAILGKDVREAIASGIEKCYEDASTARMTIPDSAVNEEKLADGAVTNNKIADGTITASKIQDGEVVKMVSYGNHVITDNNSRTSYPDISTIVQTEISDDTSSNDQYPPTSGAVKRYLHSNAGGSMSEGYGGRARISINGVTNYIPTMETAEPSGKINKDVLPLATSSSNGAMSAADKEKLDSIDLEDLENLSDISVETVSTTYGYVLRLTINGETYRIPYVNPQCKLNEKNIPTAQTVLSDNTKPVSGAAVYEYVNGSADGNPGDRKLILNINGIQYEVPMILANGKVSDSFIYTANSVTSDGASPVNGKAVYDYIEELDIGAPTDAQVDSAVSDWMEDNISYYVQNPLDDFNSETGCVSFNTIPEDPEMSTTIYSPYLETPNSKIASRLLPLATTTNPGAMSAEDKAKLDDIDVASLIRVEDHKLIFELGGNS